MEVPSVTDKKAMVIQWLSPRTLHVQGDICRPDIAVKTAEGDAGWEHEGDGSLADAGEPQEVSQVRLPTPSEASTTRVRADGILPMSPWEKLDLEWCELTHSQERDKFTNGNSVKVPSHETQINEAAAEAPTFLISERKVGPWQRMFTLPQDVDIKAVRARLNGGLLSIDLPKRDMSSEPKVKIEIE